MLWVLRDEAGHLQAACDWWLVDEQGHWNSQGAYVYLNQLEFHPGMNLHTIRRHLVQAIGQLVPWTVGVYWKRDHDRFPRPHAFRREQLLQLRLEEVKV